MKTSLLKIGCLLAFFLGCEVLLAQKTQTKEKRPTILLAPEWKVNTTVEYEAEIEKHVKQGNFVWSGNYKNDEKFQILEKNDSVYIVNWKAEGFPINIFQQYPGPMYDWFQQWSKGKPLNVKLKFNRLGVPIKVINTDSVRSYYIQMVNYFSHNLSSKDLAPLNKNAVRQSLSNLKNMVIPNKKFPQVLLENLNILFPFFGKTFYKEQDEKIIHYKTLPSMQFSVPIEIHTKLNKLSNNNYQLTSAQSPLPFKNWRIKPSGYTSIDFSYADSLDFTYNTKDFWLSHAVHKTFFERNGIKTNTVITYTRLR